METNTHADELVKSMGSALNGFFTFCEDNGLSATTLRDLYNEYYFEKVVKKSRKTTTKATIEGEKKITPIRIEDVINAETPWAKCHKMVNLKEFLKERGLRQSGNKAEMIEALLTYERKQLEPVQEEGNISVKKTAKRDLAEPLEKDVIFNVQEHYGRCMIEDEDTEIYFIVNSNSNSKKFEVIGYITLKDFEDHDSEDEIIDMRPLTKKYIKLAKEKGLEIDVSSHNLDN